MRHKAPVGYIRLMEKKMEPNIYIYIYYMYIDRDWGLGLRI